MPVDTGDVRALAVIVGALERLATLARLDSAEDRRRTGRVQREVLRARLATMRGMGRDAHGAVVVLPPLDVHEDDPVDRLRARLATLDRERTQRVDELLSRDDNDAFECLATLTREV